MNWLVLLSVLYFAGPCCSLCICGAGGFCSPNSELGNECYCNIVSKGIYEPRSNHCDVIVHSFCDEKPCTYGDCYDGFGTFICNCPVFVYQYAGHRCSTSMSIFKEFTSFVTLWYPITGQRQWVPALSAKQLTSETQIIFEFSNGRTWTITKRNCQPVSKDDLIAKCQERGNKAECSILEFTLTSSLHSFNCYVKLSFAFDRVLYDNNFFGPVGHYHDVNVRVKDVKAMHLDATYRVFLETGELMRTCPYDVKISGCGKRLDTATQVWSYSAIYLSASSGFVGLEHMCSVKSKEYKWYFSYLNHVGNFIEAQHEQAITVVPFKYGLHKGVITITVEITFREVVGIPDETVVVMCYVNLTEKMLSVHVDDGFLNYSCGFETRVRVVPTVTTLLYPESELQFTWDCPQVLCSDETIRTKALSVFTNMLCGTSLDLGLTVIHPITNTNAQWKGQITFSRPSEYTIDLFFDPDSAVTNPLLPLIITARNNYGLDHEYTWFPQLVNLTDCGSGVPSNIYMIPPGTLDFGQHFIFNVKTENGSRHFEISTATVPQHVKCNAHPQSGLRQHLDRYDLKCFARSTSPPLTYYVYEGELKELVRTSSNPNMSGITISGSPIWVEIEDSIGMKLSTLVSIRLKLFNKTEHMKVLKNIPHRIENLFLLIRDNDFEGVADEVDKITKIDTADPNIPFDWQNSLMMFLSQVHTCHWEECIHKTLNSVRRLLAIKREGPKSKYLSGVDDFILRGGSIIYKMTQSLYNLRKRSQKYPAYNLIKVLNVIHSAAHDLMDYIDPMLDLPTLDADIHRIHYRKVEQGNAYARQAIAELGLFITRHTPHPTFPFELVSELEHETTVVISHLPSYINCIAKNETDTHFQFALKGLDILQKSGYQISVAIVNYNQKNFWWAQKNNSHLAKMVEVYMYRKPVRGMNWALWTRPNEPVQMYITSVEEVAGRMEGTANAPRGANDSLMSYLNVHRVIVPRGHGTLRFHFPENLISNIHITVNKSVFPGFHEMQKPALSENLLEYRYHSDEHRTNVYIGIMANATDTQYSFNISLIRCVTRSEDMWKSEACEFERFEGNNATICACKHMSVFSVEASVPRHDRILMMTMNLNTDINHEWCAIFMILIILAGISLVYFISTWMELEDKPKRHASFLDDNWPGEEYPYLIAVHTGGRCMSGTSSNVAIRIIGESATTRVHILSSDEHRTTSLTWGQDCWFLLFTAHCLGNIQEIEVWHDGFGRNPDWYCTEIVIWDINTSERFWIPVETWLSHTALHKSRDTRFTFKPCLRHKNEWPSYIPSHIHAKLRQEHHWASVFLLHPRSRYTRLDRLLIVSVIVMVSVEICMVFYFDNLGPTDRPIFRVTVDDLYVSIKTACIVFAIASVPATLLSIGRNESLRGITSARSLFKELIQRLFAHPVCYKSVTTHSRYTKQRNTKWNCWIWLAYIISVCMIYSSIGFIVNSALNFGPNRSIVWLIVSFMSISYEAVILNTIQILVAAVFAAYATSVCARDIITISIKPEDLEKTIGPSKRLNHAFHYRLKPMYKPPLSSIVKDKAKKDARKDVFDIFQISVVVSLIILLLLLLHTMQYDMKYHEGFQLSKLFEVDYADSFEAVRNRTKYFHFLRGTVMRLLHRYTWYNGKFVYPEWEETKFSPTKRYTGYCSDYSTKLMGVAHLRQQRLSPQSSEPVVPVFRAYFQNAYGHLQETNEDRETYLPQWEVPEENETYYKTYNYQPENEAKETTFYGVSRRAYDGGGYVQNLHWTIGGTQRMLVDLELDQWLDNLTRTIFFTINLYSVFEEKVSYVTIVTECLPSGVYRSRAMTESASIHEKRLFREKTVGIIVMLIGIVVTVHLFRTITIISKFGLVKYLRTVSGFVDFSLVCAGYGLVAAFVFRYFLFFSVIEEIESAPKDVYTPLHFRFSQSDNALILIGAFSVSTVSLGCVLIHNLIGFEAINFRVARTRALVVTFSGVNLFAVYVSLNLSYSTSNNVPNLFFLLVFKEPTAFKEASTMSPYYTMVLTGAVTAFLILTRLNTAILVQFYAEGESRMEPKSVAFRYQLSSLGARLQTVRMLQRERGPPGPAVKKIFRTKKQVTYITPTEARRSIHRVVFSRVEEPSLTPVPRSSVSAVPGGTAEPNPEDNVPTSSAQPATSPQTEEEKVMKLRHSFAY